MQLKVPLAEIVRMCMCVWHQQECILIVPKLTRIAKGLCFWQLSTRIRSISPPIFTNSKPHAVGLGALWPDCDLFVEALPKFGTMLA